MGHAWVNVFYLNLTHTTVTVTDLQTIADGIHTAWTAQFKPIMTSSVVLSQVDVRFIPTSGSELRYTGSYSETGTSTDTQVSDAGACMVISWVISDYYRGGHPRMYIPCARNQTITNGSDVSSSLWSTVVGNANAFRNAINALTSSNVSAVVMGTVRFQHANAWLTPPVFTPFTSAKMGKSGKLASQRRRILA